MTQPPPPASSEHPSTLPTGATPPALKVGLGRIGQIAVPVGDIGRATAFYRDVLGMRFLFETPTLAFFDADGVRLMLSVPENGEGERTREPGAAASVAGWILYFRVKELDLAVEGFAEHGAPVERAPHMVATLPDHDLWMAFIRDSENNLLGLMEERIRRPAD